MKTTAHYTFDYFSNLSCTALVFVISPPPHPPQKKRKEKKFRRKNYCSFFFLDKFSYFHESVCTITAVFVVVVCLTRVHNSTTININLWARSEEKRKTLIVTSLNKKNTLLSHIILFSKIYSYY